MQSTLHWPQITWIVLQIISLCIAAKNHGKPRSPESFWATVFAIGVTTIILICGGFYS